jgi:hypothetical protein
MPHLSDKQLDDAIDKGVNTIFAAIQDALGTDDGGFAGQWMDSGREASLSLYLRDFFRPYADAEARHCWAVPGWKEGDVVLLMEPYECFPHFMLEAGAAGTVVLVDEETLAVLMHEHIAGCEEWDNEIVMTRDHLSEYTQKQLEAMWKKIGHDANRPLRRALSNCVELLDAVQESSPGSDVTREL